MLGKRVRGGGWKGGRRSACSGTRGVHVPRVLGAGGGGWEGLVGERVGGRRSVCSGTRGVHGVHSWMRGIHGVPRPGILN